MSSEDVQSSKPQIYDRSIYDLIYDEVNRKGRQIYRLFFSRFENLTAKDRKMLWTMMTAKISKDLSMNISTETLMYSYAIARIPRRKRTKTRRNFRVYKSDNLIICRRI
ncbi:hypothetical protein SSS_02344 [Sarcoptes scabiei]|uniref:Uncharacterized protein n=1 Tax=Sarcoptes scabiei TaxID=52283 RepID=A0A834RB16_SARSC|nr:hypothetical protein SSS_02344 [Sarcoptes scabiei]UXI16288.1 hypothetical protein NH340_JMT02231 [Sarcoptes scabiei]